MWGSVSSSRGEKDGFKVTTFSSSMKLNMCVEKGESFSIEINTEGKYAIEKKNPNHNSVRDCSSPKTFIAGSRLFLMTCFDSRAADGTVFFGATIVAFSRNFMLFFTRSKKRNNMANETLGFTDYPMLPRLNSSV